MTPREYMEKFVRRIPGGGLAWEKEAFTDEPSLAPSDLVDAAVDIAWEYLMPTNCLERPMLEVYSRGNALIFRVRPQSVVKMLSKAA
jgi:hypothetical protein